MARIPKALKGDFSCDMVQHYALDPSDVSALYNELTNTSFLNTLFKGFSDPMDNIISLKAYPCVTPILTGVAVDKRPIKIGGVATTTATGRPLVFSTSRMFNMGTAVISTSGDNDFTWSSSYASMAAYLPFIGWVHLNYGLDLGLTIQLAYTFDLITGMCTAYLYDPVTNFTFYSGSGKFGVDIPIGSQNFGELGSNYINYGSAMIDSAKNAIAALVNVIAGNYAMAGTEYKKSLESLGDAIYPAAKIASAAPSGNVSGGMCAFTQPTTPFIIVIRPNLQVPGNFYSLYGRISMKSATLSSLTGFTKIAEVHVEGSDFSGATAGEMGEIERLLKEGVIL